MSVLAAGPGLVPAFANDNETIAAFLLDVRGQAAALAGIALSENPYAVASFEAACWAAGWKAGEDALADFAFVQPRRARLRAVMAEPVVA